MNLFHPLSSTPNWGWLHHNSQGNHLIYEFKYIYSVGILLTVTSIRINDNSTLNSKPCLLLWCHIFWYVVPKSSRVDTELIVLYTQPNRLSIVQCPFQHGKTIQLLHILHMKSDTINTKKLSRLTQTTMQFLIFLLNNHYH